ncbi:MAG: SAM-dependent methyltransferase, partial [Dehalococcoidia bacterium]
MSPLTLDGFGSATDNAVLRGRIRSEIAVSGPISFRRFMELALYDPDEGYYNTRPAIGARGDYLTSPELHPLFGALVARQLAEFWRLLGEPPSCRLIEAGAGTGSLARAVLAGASSELRERLEYIIVEPSAARAAQQQATLGALAQRCRWAIELGAGAAVDAACILSNELLDSFPV